MINHFSSKDRSNPRNWILSLNPSPVSRNRSLLALYRSDSCFSEQEALKPNIWFERTERKFCSRFVLVPQFYNFFVRVLFLFSIFEFFYVLVLFLFANKNKNTIVREQMFACSFIPDSNLCSNLHDSPMFMPGLIINGAAIGPARPRICERPRSCIETSTANTSTMIRYHIPNEAEIASFPTKEIYLPN